MLTYAGATAWIEPFVGGACRLVAADPLPEPSRLRPFTRQRAARPLRRPWHALKALRGPSGIPISRSDGRLENMADVVHFPKQSAVLTDLPSIYHPWDLQHRHLGACSRRTRTCRERCATPPSLVRRVRSSSLPSGRVVTSPTRIPRLRGSSRHSGAGGDGRIPRSRPGRSREAEPQAWSRCSLCALSCKDVASQEPSFGCWRH